MKNWLAVATCDNIHSMFYFFTCFHAYINSLKKIQSLLYYEQGFTNASNRLLKEGWHNKLYLQKKVSWYQIGNPDDEIQNQLPRAVAPVIKDLYLQQAE